MNSEIAHINMNFSILPTLSYSRAQETNHELLPVNLHKDKVFLKG